MKAAKKNTMDMIKRFETLTFTFTFFAIPSLIALIWRSKNVNKIGASCVIFFIIVLHLVWLFQECIKKTSGKSTLFAFFYSTDTCNTFNSQYEHTVHCLFCHIMR